MRSEHYKHTDNYKKLVVQGQQKWRDSLYGPEEDHIKICECCNEQFTWHGRKGTTGFKKARFCSIPCSKSRTEYWDANATRYQTIAFKHHDKKCVVCGFDKIVAVHHNDCNKKNNDPSNLIPLCPNHHEMIHHSAYKAEVSNIVNDYLTKWTSTRLLK